MERSDSLEINPVGHLVLLHGVRSPQTYISASTMRPDGSVSSDGRTRITERFIWQGLSENLQEVDRFTRQPGQ